MRLLALCVLAFSASVAHSQGQATSSRPSSWGEWKASRDKSDATMVAQIEKADWWKSCQSWGRETRLKPRSRRSWAVQDFLQSERLINGGDLSAVATRSIAVGMTTCGMYAALGAPDAVNRTETAWGLRTQYVYRGTRTYVYTESATKDGNALVRSIQY